MNPLEAGNISIVITFRVKLISYRESNIRCEFLEWQIPRLIVVDFVIHSEHLRKFRWWIEFNEKIVCKMNKYFNIGKAKNLFWWEDIDITWYLYVNVFNVVNNFDILNLLNFIFFKYIIISNLWNFFETLILLNHSYFFLLKKHVICFLFFCECAGVYINYSLLMIMKLGINFNVESQLLNEIHVKDINNASMDKL